MNERGLFSSVDIVVTAIAGDKVYLAIRLKEYPKFAQYKITGNDNESDGDLKKKILLEQGDVVTGEALFNAKRGIEETYANDGYLRASVLACVVPSDTAKNTVKRFFDVVEGPEVKIGTIAFAGNKTFTQDTLKDQFDDTKEKSWWQIWRSSKFDKKKYEDDKKKLLDFFHTQGYLDARITHDSIYYTEDTTRLNSDRHVAEGAKFYVRDIAFTGNAAYPDTTLRTLLKFKKGDVFNTDKFEKNLNGNEDGTDVRSLYLDNGYLTTQLTKTRRGCRRTPSTSLSALPNTTSFTCTKSASRATRKHTTR